MRRVVGRAEGRCRARSRPRRSMSSLLNVIVAIYHHHYMSLSLISSLKVIFHFTRSRRDGANTSTRRVCLNVRLMVSPCHALQVRLASGHCQHARPAGIAGTPCWLGNASVSEGKAPSCQQFPFTLFSCCMLSLPTYQLFKLCE